MAKIADYIQEEITDAGEASEARKSELPAQFVGKSVEEIAEDYLELQKLQSQQANELGETRAANAQLIEKFTSVDSSPHTPEPVEPVTYDDLYDDPDGTINRVFENSDIAKELAEVKAELVRTRTEKVTSDFTDKFPTYVEDSKSAEMREWIQSSPYRMSMANKSDLGDVEAATELFSMYDDLRGDKDTAAQKATRNQQLADATLESGATTMEAQVDTFSRAELQNMRIMAKRGNMEAEAYMKANSAAIKKAYEEGHIVD